MTKSEPNEEPTSGEHSGDVVVVEDVDHRFGNLTVLEEISFGVAPGTFLAVIGPNGSGKTTLSRIIAGHLSPSEGEVVVTADEEHPIGYLPQQLQFRSALTVEETLQYYGDLLSTTVDIEAALTQVGMLEARNRRVSMLSGGMLRLLGIAQSILGSPRCLLLDEPWVGLDHRMTNHILQILTSLVDDDISVILTTHDLVSAEVADRIAIINQGRIVIKGSPQTIVDDSGTESLSEAFLGYIGEEPMVQTGRRSS